MSTKFFLRRWGWQVRSFLLASLGLLGVSTGLGAMTLQEAFESARVHDATFRAAKAARDVGVEERALGRAQLLPSVVASYSDGRSRSRSTAGEWFTGTGSVSASSTSSTDIQQQSRQSSTVLGRPISREVSTERSTQESAASQSATNLQRSETVVERYRGSAASASIELRQPLFDMAAFSGYRQGDALASASEAEYKAQEQELILRVSEAFSNALFEQESVRLARSQVETLSLQQTSNERMLAAGQGTITDVLETRARLELARAQLIDAEDRLAVAMGRLALVTGREVTWLAPLQLSDTTELPSTNTLEEWRALTLQNNGVLQALRFQVAAAREAANRASGGHFPRVELVGSFSRQRYRYWPGVSTESASSIDRDSQATGDSSSTETSTSSSTVDGVRGSPETTTTTNTGTTSSSSVASEASSTSLYESGSRYGSSSNRYIGVEITIPLFQGGGISARTRQAAAELIRVEAQRDGLVQELELELAQQFRLVRSEWQRIQALIQAVESSQVAVEATTRSIAAGVRTNLDLISAKERKIAAELELTGARYGYLLAYLRLRAVAGVLSPSDLVTVSSANRQ